MIIKYKIPRDLHPRLPLKDFVLSELPDDAIAIDDPRPVTGSFNMANVRRLSAHVIKLRDMPESVLVLFGLSRVWKSRVCDSVLWGADENVMGIYDFLCLHEWTGVEVQEEPHLDVRPTLQRLPFYCTPPAAADVVIPGPTREDLAVGTPSSKIVAKAEAYQKRKASTSDESDDDDDDDACVEVSLVTPLRSAAIIPSLRNQCGSSVAPAVEGSNTRDSRGKGVMVDDVVASSAGVSRPRSSFGHALSFRDVSGDAIYTNFFLFSPGPYYATYHEDGVDGNCEFTREEWDAPYRPTFRVLMKEVFKDPAVCKTIVDQFPTPGEMVRVETLSDDQLTVKMSVLHCMMMSHGGKILARYRVLNQSHHEYVLSTDSRLNGYEEKIANMTGFELQVTALKKHVSELNDKLSFFDASFAMSKAKGKERKKNIKSFTKSLDNLHTEVARLFAALNQATILEAEKDEEILRLKTTPPEFSLQGELFSLAVIDGFEIGLLKPPLVALNDYAFLNKIFEYAAERLSVILQLKPKKLVSPANVPIPKDARVSPPVAKEPIVTHASKSMELSANVDLTTFVVAFEHYREMVSVNVYGLDLKMTDDTITAKFGHAFVHGMSFVFDDDVKLAGVGLRHVSSSPNDVVVSLSTGEKGDGLTPSHVAS
uniref:Transposase (Putative), gypsy type n=1 Tax=Tanacetum cinerariifolium TaxID=118510 RepID=A0A699GU59_TANCI|nr:hypothetical protein [Tanacetum cinerariifolium]